MSYKIFVLYRKNKFYEDIQDFLNKYSLEQQDVIIYNCTEENFDLENIKTDEKIETIIKSIYHSNNNTYCIILDTCIKYNSLDINDEFVSDKSYCLLNYNNFKIPIILGKTINSNNMDILLDYDAEYDDYIECDGDIDELFYDNFFSKNSTACLILASILDINIKNIDNFFFSDEKSKIYFKFCKVYNEIYLEDDIILDILNNTYTDIHIVFLLIDELIQEYNQVIIDTIIKNFHIYTKNTPFIIVNNFDMYTIYDYIIEYFITKPLFIISDIPDWVLGGCNDDLYKYYPIINDETIKIKLPFKLTNNIKLKDLSSIELNDENINITNQGLIIHKDTSILIKSITPVSYYLVNKDQSIITYNNYLYYRDYLLKGTFIPFNNYLLGLFEEKNRSCRILLLDPKTLKLLLISKNFTISNQLNAISLYKDLDEQLHIVSYKNEEIFMCPINYEKLFTTILSKNILKTSPFSLTIELKNSIGLQVFNFNFSDKIIHKNYTFYNLPTENKYFIQVKFSPAQKLLEIDNRLLYINKFLFLNNLQNINLEKTADIYFHKSAKNTDLYTKCVEMQISTNIDYKYCKYYIIDQNEFEKLDSLEISNIIGSQCLIISLIDEDLLKNRKLKNIYTSNETLIKLFLFNIVKNTTYIQFIFERIIHANEYNKRKEFMIVDLENIARENNIYDCILDNINHNNDNNDIELNNKDCNLLNTIKSQILSSLSTEIYSNILNIVKYIISNNFNIKISFMDIDNNFIERNNYKNILKILFKINWLGKIDFNG